MIFTATINLESFHRFYSLRSMSSQMKTSCTSIAGPPASGHSKWWPAMIGVDGRQKRVRYTRTGFHIMLVGRSLTTAPPRLRQIPFRMIQNIVSQVEI